MTWTLPQGWHGKLSVSKGRWYFWHEADPASVTWTPPSWNDVVADSYNAHLEAHPSTSLFRSCQNFCKSAVLTSWLFANLTGPSRVLDIGCGKGGDGAKMPPHHSFTGIDIADAALAEGSKRFPQHAFHHADFTHPTQTLHEQIKSPSKFDAAWSSFAFHYGGDALDVALRNVRSVLKTGASFLFIVLDEGMEARCPSGNGPLHVDRWEKRDVGDKGVCMSSSKCWVTFHGSFSSLPECILTRAQIEAACAVSKFSLTKTELLGTSIQSLYDWAETSEAQSRRADLETLRKRYRDSSMWDSTHFAFANCYRVWIVKAV